MKVYVLAENTPNEEFEGEHGLSLYVEHNGKNYLIDTGASGLFSKNAEKLGIDLSKVDAAFLSHAHYDHSGGFREFFELNAKAKVFLQETCRTLYYFKIAGPIKKYIGIPEGILDEYADRFEYLSGLTKIADGVYICPHTTPGMELRGKRAHMFGVVNDKMTVDDFSHEQTVVFEENGELYLFNSCSHGGVENIIEEVKRIFPDKPIKAFFGGFHMMGTLGVNTCEFKESEVKATARKLLNDSDADFYTGHCTGKVAEKWLGDVLGERFILLHSGMKIEF